MFLRHGCFPSKLTFLKEIPIDSDRFLRFAGPISGFLGSTYAWVFPPAEVWNHHGVAGTRPQLWFANTAYLTSENAWWLPQFLARMSIMQPVNARTAAATSKALGGGVPNVSSSALLGRSDQKDVLDETMATYSLRGSAPIDGSVPASSRQSPATGTDWINAFAVVTARD
jgi:hypothetical protein